MPDTAVSDFAYFLKYNNFELVAVFLSQRNSEPQFTKTEAESDSRFLKLGPVH